METAAIIGIILLVIITINQIMLMFAVTGVIKQNEAFRELLFGNEHVININELNDV